MPKLDIKIQFTDRKPFGELVVGDIFVDPDLIDRDTYIKINKIDLIDFLIKNDAGYYNCICLSDGVATYFPWDYEIIIPTKAELLIR